MIGTPGAVDTYTFRNHDTKLAETYNATLEALGKIDKQIADQRGVGFADVHAAMADAMAELKAKYGQTYAFADTDGVHPGPIVMAYAFLKAMNLPGDVKVTFGERSKTFPAADLSRGVNLAAVRAKQDRETMLDKNFYTNVPALEQQMPEARDELAAMEKPIRDLLAAPCKSVAATVVPVRYTIKAEPATAAEIKPRMSSAPTSPPAEGGPH